MITSVATLVFATKYTNKSATFLGTTQKTNTEPQPSNDMQASNTSSDQGYTNWESAAEISSKAVVHIKTEMKARNVQYRSPYGDDFFDQFFEGGSRFFQQPTQQRSGSGVII